MSYQVIVTYGTLGNQIYAKTDTPEGAKRLKKLAISLGYADARIVQIDRQIDEQKERQDGKPRTVKS